MENEPDASANEGPVTNDDEDVVFVFYYDLVKSMILKRHDVEYICTLTSWLKALENYKNKTVRNEYIRLMVSVLQNADQLCPFKEYPPETFDPLQNDVFEKAKKLRQGDGTATCVGFNEADNPRQPYPTISTAVSQDKRQYAACQVIPNVGVQCYYAFSDDHLYNWTIPSAISVPASGPHTRDVDWERAMAGIHSKRTINSPSAENLDPETAAKTVKIEKEPKENDESEMCKVMFIEQQIRGVTEIFEWNDASLLTGEIILGAEMGSDRKVNAQVKTQSELDKEVGNCFDKLYPGDFRVQANPSFLSDIIHQKTNGTETETTGEQQCEEICKQVQRDDRAGRPCGGGGGGGGGTRIAPSNARRQEAGQENTAVITVPDENVLNVTDGQVDLRRKIFDISSDLAALNHSLESKYLSKNRRQDDPTAACSQTGTADSGADDVPNRRAESNRDHRPTTDSKLRTDLLDFQRQIKMAEDCRNNVQRSLSRNNNPNCKNPKNIDHSDSNETSSDASIQRNM